MGLFLAALKIAPAWGVICQEDTVTKFIVFIFAMFISTHANSSDLNEAISAGNESLALQLILKTEDLNEQDKHGATAIYLASLRGQKDVVEKLLSLGVDLNILAKNGENALHAAADKEQVEIAKMLLEAGINHSLKNKYGDTPLDYYRNYPEHPMALLLAKHGASTSK